MTPAESLIAEPVSVRRWIALRLRAIRAFSLPVSVGPVLVATAAVRPVGQWHWGILVASVFGAALLHLAGNLLNDYFDFRSGVDRRVEGDQNRPGRLLVRGELQPRDIFREAMVCLLLAATAGLYLVWLRGPGLLWFALVGAAALYSYTGPPFKLKYRTLGEAVIFLTFGPFLMTGAAYAQTGRVELSALLLAVPVGLATTAILVANNLRDREEDRTASVRTLAQLGDGRLARALYVGCILGCVFGLAGLAAAGLAPRPLVFTPILLVLFGRPLASVWQNRRLPDIDAKTARAETVLLCCLIVTFVCTGPV